MRASELSRISGINDGLISKWINGQQKFVSNDDLANLAGAISHEAKDRAELIRAHLLDELAGPGSELIEIKVRGLSSSALKEESTQYSVDPLPLKIQRALEILARESLTDADVRSIILSLANMLQPALSSTGVEAGKKIGDAIGAEAANQNNPSRRGK